MSSSEPVLLHAPADDGVQVTVVDHSFAPLDSGLGGVSLEVQPGLYSVRYVTGSTVHQELVTVPPGQRRVVVPRPSLHFHSPAPLSASTPVSERHLDAARRLSREVHGTLGSGAQLFVFVRDRDRRGRRSPLAGLTLHDQDGELLLDLGEAGIACSEHERVARWAGITVAVDPGPYRLRVRTGAVGTLEQLVFLAGGWQTQAFMERRVYPGHAGGRTADIGGASILMAPLRRGFDPARDDLRLTELARQSLSIGRAVLQERDLRNMLFMKWKNPMLGIYGAHMLQQTGEPETLFDEVVRNLGNLVPGHPDVACLGLARGAAEEPFRCPPMLRASWQLVVRSSAEHPEIVPADSLAGRVAGLVFDSSTWLIWRVPPARRKPRRTPQEDISVIDLMNGLAAAVPELDDVREHVFAQMDPVEQDLLTFATGVSGSTPPTSALGDERKMLQALGMPKSVAQENLLRVADRLDVRLD